MADITTGIVAVGPAGIVGVIGAGKSHAVFVSVNAGQYTVYSQYGHIGLFVGKEEVFPFI